jgi:hypothetical protein
LTYSKKYVIIIVVIIRKDRKMDDRRTQRDSVGLAARRLLKEIRALDEREDLTVEERETEQRRFSCLILDLPEVAPLVREALQEMERRAKLSWEVRDHIIDRIGDALIKQPEIATERRRLRGLIRQLTKWGVSDKERYGRAEDGTPLSGHTRWASRLDDSVEGSEGEVTSKYELVEDPGDLGVLDHLIHRERLEEALDVARGMGDSTFQTVQLFMSGLSYREIGDHEGVSENAIAKRIERFRHHLAELGV